MDTLSRDAETYQTDLERLLAHADKRETPDEMRRYFQHLLTFVERSANKLEAVEKEQDEALWAQHEGWNFDDVLTRPSFLGKLLGSVDVLLHLRWRAGQRDTLPQRGELLKLFESVRAAVLGYDQRKRELDERILASLRKKYPGLSSVGIIDAPTDVLGGEVRSDRLKEFKALDRR